MKDLLINVIRIGLYALSFWFILALGTNEFDYSNFFCGFNSMNFSYALIAATFMGVLNEIVIQLRKLNGEKIDE